ncbi:hypothetical protein EYZ11_009847 [Aspergillus tanneri]|nr:hypothetical protein EYZ11_009847 [Aspergillus tanneri]
MDESVAPNLAATALNAQSKQIFQHVVHATFPGTFATFGQRVDPNWKDFVLTHPAAQNVTVTWCIRCLSTWFLAKRHQDKNLLITSRHLYSRGLRCLLNLLRIPSMVKSDTVLATAMMLGVYEMFDGVGPNSWLIHSHGIGALFCLRGPQAHQSGFGRTMHLTYRSFLVAEAFQRQEACFLAEPEWQEMNREMLAVEEREGKGSKLGAIIEHTFNEMALCPGFLKRTSDQITCRMPESVGEILVEEIRHSVAILRDLQLRLSSIPAKMDREKCGQRRGSITGPIPVDFVHMITKSSLQAIRSAVALQDQLLVLLEARKIQSCSLTGAEETNAPWSLEPVQSVHELVQQTSRAEDNMDHEEQTKGEDWLDHLAMSMGTLAIKS